MLRSACVSTVVDAGELLLAGVGSVVVAVELAVLLRVVPSGVLGTTVAVMTTVSRPPAAIVPRLSEPVQVAELPPLRLYVAPLRKPLSGSLRTTPWASEGPALVTVIV